MIFGLVTVIVLSSLGLFVYFETRAHLVAAVDQGLQSRAQVITGTLGGLSGGVIPTSGAYVQPDEAVAQVIAASTAIVDSSTNVRGRRIIPISTLRTMQSTAYLTRRIAGFDEPIRLFVTRYELHGERGFVVVGETLGDTNEALSQMAHNYLSGAAIAFLGVLGIGWWLLRSSLRPVERMRREAAAISLGDPNARLRESGVNDELNRLARTLNSMLARLRATYEQERRFIDHASHELRTPLTALRTEIDLALEGPRSNVELVSALQSAGEEADRLIQLSEDLLALTLMEHGRLPLHRTPVSMGELVGPACDAMRARARFRGVTIAETSDRAFAELDSRLLRHALANLLDNAVRHSPRGGTVSVDARRRGRHMSLEVTDEGDGFPIEFLERAFEPFSRADRDSDGSGLGLSIVEAVARAHDGTALAENLPNGGARVTLMLPDVVIDAHGAGLAHGGQETA